MAPLRFCTKNALYLVYDFSVCNLFPSTPNAFDIAKQWSPFLSWSLETIAFVSPVLAPNVWSYSWFLFLIQHNPRYRLYRGSCWMLFFYSMISVVYFRLWEIMNSTYLICLDSVYVLFKYSLFICEEVIVLCL